jgi:chromosome segregation ATPase
MDKHLAGLKQAQEEFHQAFNNCLEDVEDEMLVCKTNVNVFRIQMSSMEKDIKDVEMSVDNSQLWLEKVEDQVEGLVDSMSRLNQQSLVSQVNHRSLGAEIQRVQGEAHQDHESPLGKFATNNTIIDRKFIRFDKELERVVDLAGQKINRKFGECSLNFMEAMEIEENWRKDLEEKVTALETRLEHTLAHTANSATLLLSVQSRVSEVEDAIMEESGEEDAEGDTTVSTSSSEFDPVENMVAIPIPPPVIHTLIPVEVPEAFIPPSLQSTPSPPYVEAHEEDPAHDGIPEYWTDPEAGLS